MSHCAQPICLPRWRRWRLAWGRQTPRYLAYQAAAFVLMNLGEDVALAALLFVN